MKLFAITFFGLAVAFSESSEDEDYDWEEIMNRNQICASINYAILSAANPTDYPSIGMFEGTDFVQDGDGSCNANGMTVAEDCDCEDAENYRFHDYDLCERLEQDADSDEDMSEGMDTLKSLVCERIFSMKDIDDEFTKKDFCTIINYSILSNANPTDYPTLGEWEGTDFVQDGANCKAGGETVADDCDCSNAKSYSFADQDFCETLEKEAPSDQKMPQGFDTFKSLICISDVSDECTDAQKSLEAEENFIQKGVLKLECDAACSEFPNETCGFLVSSVSMILFAVLAMLKY